MIPPQIEWSQDAYAIVQLASRVAESLRERIGRDKQKASKLLKVACALSKMPDTWKISGAIRYGIVRRVEGSDASETRCYAVDLSGEAIILESGGGVYDRAVGSDAYSDDRIELHADGTVIRAWAMVDWEDEFLEHLPLGGELEIEGDLDAPQQLGLVEPIG